MTQLTPLPMVETPRARACCASSSIGRAASLSLSEPLDEVRRNAHARRALGLDYLVCSWPGQGRQRVEEFWTTTVPEMLD